MSTFVRGLELDELALDDFVARRQALVRLGQVRLACRLLLLQFRVPAYIVLSGRSLNSA